MRSAAFPRLEGSTPPPDERPSLLLIDDDSMVGRFIAHGAEECGYRPTKTTCLESFSRCFRQERPDVVAVDLCIASHDGIEIIRFLAEENFEGSVVIISGLDRRVLDASLRLGEALGLRMTEPLPKPFLIHELARRLEEADRRVTA